MKRSISLVLVFDIGLGFRESGNRGYLDNESRHANCEVSSPTILLLKSSQAKGGDEVMP